MVPSFFFFSLVIKIVFRRLATVATTEKRVPSIPVLVYGATNNITEPCYDSQTSSEQEENLHWFQNDWSTATVIHAPKDRHRNLT